MNAVKKNILIDILEDVDGYPKEGETLKMIKKDLRKMKVTENREEPFRKKDTYYLEDDTDVTYHVWNTDDDRSRRDNWKKIFVRSESCPGYFRTASRNNYVRDHSKLRRS